MTISFIHLHMHSEYSIKDSLLQIDTIVENAVKQKMPAIALTDHMNLFAVVKFYQACERAGIKPIIGAQIALYNEASPGYPFTMILLCQNHTGYHHLRQLLSRAYREGQTEGFPQIKKEWLINANQGLILLSGSRFSDVGQALLNNDRALAKTLTEGWIAVFGNRFYLEIVRTDREYENDYIKNTIALATKMNIPIVATNDVRFLQAEDYDAHEARVCIHNGTTLDDQKRTKHYSEKQYLRTAGEMQKLFADLPEALENSVEIAKRCNVKLKLNQVYLPQFPVPNTYTIDSYLKEQSQQGLQKRLAQLYPQGLAQEKLEIYQERLEIELKVIIEMGFAGYFLIVADFIAWSKENGIPVGPGRGSGAGSLVAYVLGITDLDPLQYDLLFERFLNPERVSMPDFDVDFCMEGRDRVIEYVAQKYGRDSVSQIITFGTMAAKAVVRDVGRVLGHPYGFVDKIAKLIPFELGITLEKALAQEDLLRQRYNQESEVTHLIDLARKLEGITRNAGKHAGGVVIAPSDLTDFVPLYCEPGSEQILSQFDKDDVETIGLVKFDFLGLRTLTIINWALLTINAKRDEVIDINFIPMDDVKSFDLLKACETTAVFQLESRGMKDLIKRLQPDCFEDIIALVALFRPGPLQSGMVDDFIDRKHGRATVDYPHPKLEPILSPTYGVILYQEQVMQIAQVLAGYTLGGADILRRAMGKKKPEEMAKQRQIFTEGAVANGVEEQTATYIFDLMEKFAGYGFNKSHSAAYALVAYQTAWLKAHYPAEFMAAVLSSDMDNTDKVVIFIDECRARKLNIISPDINQGYYKFTVTHTGDIVYGLGAIKGLGESVIEHLVNEREMNGPYKNLFELCRRVDGKKVTRRVFEALIKAGALDSFHVERASLFASLEKALLLAEQEAKNRSIGQEDLFSTLEAALPEQTYITVKPWHEKERLEREKETLGLYLSGHPIARYQQELSAFTTARIVNLTASYEKAVVIAGYMMSIRTLMTKKGDKMAFMSLDDGSARIDIAIFSNVFEQYQELLIKDQILVVEGNVSFDDYTGGLKMSAQKIMTLEKARLAYAISLLLKIDSTLVDSQKINLLQTHLTQTAKGKLPVMIEYAAEAANCRLQLGDNFRIYPSDEILMQLQDLFGQGSVAYEYR